MHKYYMYLIRGSDLHTLKRITLDAFPPAAAEAPFRIRSPSDPACFEMVRVALALTPLATVPVGATTPAALFQGSVAERGGADPAHVT
jgi:hypothetical protein